MSEQGEPLTSRMLQDTVRGLHLNTLQRVLLATDGMVTTIVEAYAQEPIYAAVLGQEVTSPSHAIPSLGIGTYERRPLLYRSVLLRGRVSEKAFLFASSIIVLDRLHEKIRDGLLEGDEPFGRMLAEHRIETFRDLLSFGQQNEPSLATYFEMNRQAQLVFRVYRIVARGRPVALITEKFPRSCFTQEDK